jgi:hypothetical protein
MGDYGVRFRGAFFAFWKSESLLDSGFEVNCVFLSEGEVKRLRNSDFEIAHVNAPLE